MIPDLIYDLGVNNGDDSAYYLSLGHKVIGIEANPVLALSLARRFQAEIGDGRYRLLNIGVTDLAGSSEFWINKTRDDWSSFNRATASRKGRFPVEGVLVRCLPFSDILQQHGTPFYLKIDIEGNDGCALRGLDLKDLPVYLSFEANSLRDLAMAISSGYNAFKCVDQTNHNSPRPALQNELLPSYFAGCIWHLWQRFSPKARKILGFSDSNDGGAWRFPPGSSGPIGENAFGDWHCAEHAAYNWLHRKLNRKRRGDLNPWGWFDFHATVKSGWCCPACKPSHGTGDPPAKPVYGVAAARVAEVT
jgi:FkbM family methyltransferase